MRDLRRLSRDVTTALRRYNCVRAGKESYDDPGTDRLRSAFDRGCVKTPSMVAYGAADRGGSG
jgi:hypothetical protein